MRYSLHKLVGSILVLGVVALAAPHAFADDISNNLDATVDAAAENMALTAGGANGTTTLRVVERNSDGKNGCNLTGSTTLVVGVNTSNASVATASPTSITFSSCSDLRTVTVTPVSAGSTTISLSLVSNSTAGTFNLAPATFTVQVAPADSTPPTWSCTPAAADGVWHDADQSSNCTASDLSGLQAGSPATFILSTNVAAGTETANASTNSRQLCDVHGTCTTAGPITGWKIDKKAPVVQCIPAAANGVWHSTNQTASCTATDGGSGINGATNVLLSTDVALGAESASASTDSHNFCDNLTHCTTAGPIPGWMIDRQAPLATCIPPAADGAWHGTDQSSVCTATDTNGLAPGSPASFTLITSVASGSDDSNASTNSQTLCDTLGNCTTVGPISGWMIDKQAPEYECTPSDGLWHNDDIDISCTATDANGLRADSPASFTLSTDVAAGTETSNASTGTRQLCDIFDNCTTAGPITGLKVDKKAPSFSCDPADDSWHKENQSSSCAVADGGSGVTGTASATLTTSVVDGVENANASTDSHDFCDNVGNCATAGPVTGWKIDRKAPAATCAPADSVWHDTNQSSSCSATDGGSGVTGNASATLTTSVADGVENANASTDSHDFCDNVGNCSTAGPVTGWKIDRKAPAATCTPAEADTAWHSYNQTVSCDATDGGSGIDGSAAALLNTSVADGVEDANASTDSHDFCDNVGNCTTAGPITGWKIDRKAPTATCTPADAIWHGSNQTSVCTAVDGGSGVAGSATANVMTYVSEGDDDANAFTATDEFCDNVGNCAETTPVGGWMIDRKAPDATCVPPTADAVWHGLDQSHACTATDTSGLAPGSPASFTLTTSVAAGSDDSNASTGSQLLCDIVGNCTTAGPITGWMIDKKAPEYVCTPADTVWHNANQTSTCTATDTSGLEAGSPASFTLTTTVAAGSETSNASTGMQQLCDNVGNCATAGPVTGWKIDRKGPAATCGSADSVWHDANQSSSCAATDGGSGVAGSASATLTTSEADGVENANASTDSHNFCDNVGNCTTAGPVTGWKIDRKGPVATCAPADDSWHNENQSSSCAATDGGSGVAGSASATLTTSEADAVENANALTDSHNFCDNVGNCITAGPVSGWKIDRKDPTFSCTPADALWHNANQSSSCTALDSGSGIANPSATLSTTVADGADDANASTGTHQFCDNVGNCTTAGPVSGWKIDRKDPTNVAFAGSITNGASYYFSFVPANNMTCTASDSGSGLASCNVTGYGQTVGPHTLTATATDAVGNVTTATLTYYVLGWTVNGFYQPVDMETGVWNTVKGGSTVPLKFNVFAGTTELTRTSVVKSFTATKVPCPNGAPEDAIEFVTTGSTTLRYDTTGRQFIQNWQTPKLAGTCVRVTLVTADGTSITASFKLK